MAKMQGISIRPLLRSAFKFYIKKINYYIYPCCNSAQRL